MLEKEIADLFSVWDKITPSQQELILKGSIKDTVKAETVIHNGDEDCIGIVLIKSGRLRVYFLNENGKEITLYRLFERDVCLLSATCAMNNIQFDVNVETETDCELITIGIPTFKKLMDESIIFSNYINKLMASRFSEVMWLIEQILFKKMDSRLANFLYQEKLVVNSIVLEVTHDKIARHLGTAREVITRLLKYFQKEGVVKVHRGGIEIVDEPELIKIMNK